MRERPILFSAPMVRAILEDRKTQTRRVVKPQPELAQLLTASGWSAWHNERGQPLRCPYGQPGDRLWAREAFAGTSQEDLIYRTTVRDDTDWTEDEIHETRWRPSIHMPRWASRIDLEVTGVRVERLQDISAEECIAEGLQSFLREHDAVRDLGDQFRELWIGINGPDSWAADPWVWVVEFKRMKP